MVLTRDRYIWLRKCLRSFDRIRFSDDLVFAKVTILPYNVFNISAVGIRGGFAAIPQLPSHDYFHHTGLRL
jgi:hypothetical protein